MKKYLKTQLAIETELAAFYESKSEKPGGISSEESTVYKSILMRIEIIKSFLK